MLPGAPGRPRHLRGEPTAMPPSPNTLLITTDQQRRDTLSCLGAPIGRTPHLDAPPPRDEGKCA